MHEREQDLGKDKEPLETNLSSRADLPPAGPEMPTRVDKTGPEITVYPPIAGGSQDVDSPETSTESRADLELPPRDLFDRFQEFVLRPDRRFKIPDSEKTFRRVLPGIARRVDVLVESGHLTGRERNLIQKAIPAVGLIIPPISLAGVPFAGGSLAGFWFYRGPEVLLANLPIGIFRVWAIREIAKRHATSFNWLSYGVALFPGGGAFTTTLSESAWLIAKYYFRTKILPTLRGKLHLPREKQ